MTATTYPTAPAPIGRATTVTRSLHGEWTKLRTLPSTWRTAALSIALGVGFSLLAVAVQASEWHTMAAQQRQAFDPTSTSLTGLLVAALVFGALGVRTVTAEYATGMIRSTFTAMPDRRLVLAAKAATAAALVFPITLASNIASFAVGQRILAGKDLQVSIGHPGVVQALLLGAVAVSLIAIIGVGLAGLIRHTAGAITALAMLIVGTFTLQGLIPVGLRQYMPGSVLQAVVTVHRSTGLLKPDTAIVVLTLYATVILGAATLRIARRDA